jgi:hypothetical protein
MLPERVRLYLLRGLETTPDLLDRLLGNVTDPAIYDRRPDPERFTLLEVLAHLADWEEVFQQRLRQTLEEDNPPLLGPDPAQVAAERDYAHADPAECRARFRRGRAELLTVLRGLTPAQWERVGMHSEVGPLTLETQAVMIASHDGYHLHQILGWLPD